MTAEPRHDPASPAAPSLSLDRRGGLARETLRLIRDMSDSLVEQAHEARRRCRAAGEPEPMAAQIDGLVAQAERLRAQGDQLERAFAVLDRLVPPAPAGSRGPGTPPGPGPPSGGSG
jgi:hypothetical protein